MNYKKVLIGIGSITILTILMVLFLNIRPAAASDGAFREKCVSTVEVKEGDTLWSIAATYYTTDYKDISDLVYEIKESNHIDDTVFIGQHIIVPHYREVM